MRGKYISIKCPNVNCAYEHKVYQYATVVKKCQKCKNNLYRVGAGKISIL